MSLMQQFAINTAIMELKAGGLLSVNASRGTGKATLLRDVIAQNLVERARVLVRFSQVANTLDEQGCLVPELTGFEMVVASSNNAAAENISCELPQIKSLGQVFKSIDYLKPLANQLNANKRKGKLQPIKYQEDQCWGAISAAMGCKKKHEDFVQRFFFDTHHSKQSEEEANRPGEINFLSLWRWHALYQGLSFAEARQQFEKKFGKFDQ